MHHVWHDLASAPGEAGLLTPPCNWKEITSLNHGLPTKHSDRKNYCCHPPAPGPHPAQETRGLRRTITAPHPVAQKKTKATHSHSCARTNTTFRLHGSRSSASSSAQPTACSLTGSVFRCRHLYHKNRLARLSSLFSLSPSLPPPPPDLTPPIKTATGIARNVPGKRCPPWVLRGATTSRSNTHPHGPRGRSKGPPSSRRPPHRAGKKNSDDGFKTKARRPKATI